MFGNELDIGEYYMNGIPDDVIKCIKCHNQLDLENKSQYHLPWCIKCRTKYIKNVEFEYNKR